jgi:hypothetical protein
MIAAGRGFGRIADAVAAAIGGQGRVGKVGLLVEQIGVDPAQVTAVAGMQLDDGVVKGGRPFVPFDLRHRGRATADDRAYRLAADA